MSHFKGKKLEVSVQVVVSVLFFGFFFFSTRDPEFCVRLWEW